MAWRYSRAKKRNHFVSFITLASVLGIALGVTVLITVLSVMNGFEFQVKKRFFALAPQVTVQMPYAAMADWKKTATLLSKEPGVEALAPFAGGMGIIVNGQQFTGLQFLGIIPSEEQKISELGSKIVAGNLASLQANKFNIVLGQTIADKLNVALGDKITVMTPQTSVTLAGVFPRYRQFTISGIFHASDGFGFDSSIAYIDMSDALKLFGSQQSQNGINLKLSNLYAAPQISSALQAKLPISYSVSNWTQTFGAFAQALDMEKSALFIILLLIVAVATFNLVSTLVMVVNDKQADIAILRTLGATPGLVMRSFILQGAIIGLIGTLLGLCGGIILSLNVTTITDWIQNTFHVQFLNSSLFIIDYLPSKITLSDVVSVCLCSFGLSLLATVYPAWVAFRTQPAEALRYE